MTKPIPAVPRFTQIISDRGELIALDADGRVWGYVAEEDDFFAGSWRQLPLDVSDEE